MIDRFVYFDLGNVLVTFEHETAVQQLAAVAHKPADLVRSVVFESGLQDRYETGLLSSSEYVERINASLETQLAPEQVLEAVSAIFSPNHSIIAALEKLYDADVPMGVLSNTCEAHWKWILDQGWPMPGTWFQVEVLSYQVQSMKPETLIYQVCEEKAPCEPGNIFFTDDRQENIAAAKARGWSTCLYRSTDDLLNHLAAWLSPARS